MFDLTLGRLLNSLAFPDNGEEGKDYTDYPVELNTSDRSNLHLLSVYEHKGKIIVDIGEDGE